MPIFLKNDLTHTNKLYIFCLYILFIVTKSSHTHQHIFFHFNLSVCSIERGLGQIYDLVLIFAFKIRAEGMAKVDLLEVKSCCALTAEFSPATALHFNNKQSDALIS